jgi:hypothetical protein
LGKKSGVIVIHQVEKRSRLSPSKVRKGGFEDACLKSTFVWRSSGGRLNNLQKSLNETAKRALTRGAHGTMVIYFQHHYIPVELAKKRGLYSETGRTMVKERLVGKGYRFGTLKKPFGEYFDRVYFDMAGFEGYDGAQLRSASHKAGAVDFCHGLPARFYGREHGHGKGHARDKKLHRRS